MFRFCLEILRVRLLWLCIVKLMLLSCTFPYFPLSTDRISVPFGFIYLNCLIVLHAQCLYDYIFLRYNRYTVCVLGRCRCRRRCCSRRRRIGSYRYSFSFFVPSNRARGYIHSYHCTCLYRLAVFML